MADLMMRMAGRGDDGTAKALRTDNTGNVMQLQSRRQVVLLDATFTVATAGFHAFGKSYGRSNQTILDIGDYSRLTVIVESPSASSANPGYYEFCFYSEANRPTVGLPATDSAVMYVAPRQYSSIGKKTTYTAHEYTFMDVSAFKGMVVYFASAPVGAGIKVKVIGGQ